MSEESDSGTSSSSDEEYLPGANEEFEKSFFKTLSSLKNNDPSIYIKENKFFDDSTAVIPVKIKKKGDKVSKEKPLFLKDYERKCMTENEGYDDDKYDEEDNVKTNGLPYAVEQRQLKESFKSFFKDSDDEEEGNLLKPAVRSEQDVEKEEADYIQWLKGQKQELEDKATEDNLKNLRDYWNSDNLGEDEAFLRDYILNKKFIDKEESEDEDDNGELSDDSETFEAQEKFETEYNLRFESGDSLIRRFPRNVEDSLRRKDNKRSKKRAEVKERKGLEKKKKREEINRQKKLKVKEIAERLEKLKELTGNEKLAFNDDDILNDFDPAEHDKKMSEMYNDDFYNEDDGNKPKFDDVDLGDIHADGLEGEQYDEMKYDEPEEEGSSRPKKEKKKTRTERKKERKKKAFTDISSIEKPIYDPKLHKSYQKYMDEYYQLDCEDFIEDIPCRFKYKQVEPNDFGLSVEEILTADDKELNHWSSIKKIYKIRSSHVEKNEAKMYKLKGQNESLKQKILPSLYKTEDEPKVEESNNNDNSKIKKKSKKNNKSKKNKKSVESPSNVVEENVEITGNNEDISECTTTLNENVSQIISDANTSAKSKKRKRKMDNSGETHPNNKLFKESESKEDHTAELDSNEMDSSDHNMVGNQRNKPHKNFNKSNHNYKFKKNHKGGKFNKNHNFHDTRLSAYGLNPKKFKCKT